MSPPSASTVMPFPGMEQCNNKMAPGPKPTLHDHNKQRTTYFRSTSCNNHRRNKSSN